MDRRKGELEGVVLVIKSTRIRVVMREIAEFLEGVYFT